MIAFSLYYACKNYPIRSLCKSTENVFVNTHTGSCTETIAFGLYILLAKIILFAVCANQQKISLLIRTLELAQYMLNDAIIILGKKPINVALQDRYFKRKLN